MRFSDVAIFVLATTRPEPHRVNSSSSLSSRIVPMMQTWGGYFPYTYFVFGTNEVDHEYVHSTACTQKRRLDDHGDSPRRRLRARTRQVPSSNITELYTCRQEGIDLNVLFVGNCTGEYFGIGPVCRCQESLRYYLNDPELASRPWFAFLDDDLYMRPHALVAMLEGVAAQSRTTSDDNVYALVSTEAYRSFQFSSRWRNRGNLPIAATTRTYNCKVPSAHNFPVAMPAFFPRATVLAMRSALDGNGLTRLQETWGGSGDALLGMLLWLYEIPVLSFARAYTEASSAPNEWNLKPFNRTQIVVVHKVKNIQNLRNKRGIVMNVPGQHDVCRFFGDVSFIVSLNMTSHEVEATDQISAGRRAAASVFLMKLGSVKQTVYSTRGNLREKWYDFKLDDCALLD